MVLFILLTTVLLNEGENHNFDNLLLTTAEVEKENSSNSGSLHTTV